MARAGVPFLVPGITGLTGVKKCSELVTIDCLRAIYNIPVGKTSHSGNELGIAEWADYLHLPDLKIFFENYTNPAIPSNTQPEFISIDGGVKNGSTVLGNGLESGLDIMVRMSLFSDYHLPHTSADPVPSLY